MGRRLPTTGDESPSLREAHHLLDLHHLIGHPKKSSTTVDDKNNGTNQKSDYNKSNLTRSEIQSAFLRAARRHHPDGKHRSDAAPSVELFRRCHEARRLLLAHHCGIFPRDHGGARSSHYYYDYRRGSAATKGAGGGFPFRTLRLLTPKQNFALRGGVFLVLAVGSVYDDWTRKGVRRRVEGR